MGRAIRREDNRFLTAVLLVAITPLCLRFAMGVRSEAQLIVSCVSMLIWVYALQQGPVPFLPAPWYEPWYGSVAPAIWTLLPPMFLYRRSNAAGPGAGAERPAGGGGR